MTLQPEVPPAMNPTQMAMPIEELDYSTLCALAAIGRAFIEKPLTIKVCELGKTHVRIGFDMSKTIRCVYNH